MTYYYQHLTLHHDYLIVTNGSGALAFVGSPDAGLPEAGRFGLTSLIASPLAAPAVAGVQALLTGKARRYAGALALTGTAFQQLVWAGLQRIPYGATWTYGQLAAAIGRPTAVRAVATAVGKTPAMVVVPCHRVIRSDGQIGQFRGGVAMKRALLVLEAGGVSEF